MEDYLIYLVVPKIDSLIVVWLVIPKIESKIRIFTPGGGHTVNGIKYLQLGLGVPYHNAPQKSNNNTGKIMKHETQTCTAVFTIGLAVAHK